MKLIVRRCIVLSLARLQTDPYYDRETEESDKKKDESKKKLQARQSN